MLNVRALFCHLKDSKSEKIGFQTFDQIVHKPNTAYITSCTSKETNFSHLFIVIID